MSFFEILYRLIIGPIELLLDVVFSLSLQMTESPILSIVVLSLAINILVLPLYNRADAIQKEERETALRLKPRIDRIKKAFSGDERFMILQTFYRQNHYKPYYTLKGSLSLLLQIPFFMAAYTFLSHLEVLQGVSVGPIQDLGMPDGILKIGEISVNLLPILMTLINICSGIVYTRGMSLRSKIQLYGMAIVFLVLLYQSPAGLVIYWTLNNLFSLGKNLVNRTREPKKVVCVLCSLAGIVVALLNYFHYHGSGSRRALWGYAICVLLQMPVIGLLIRKKVIRNKRTDGKSFVIRKPGILFFSGCIMLTILTGLLIPTAVIVTSPAEFVDVHLGSGPFQYAAYAFLISAGLFLVWFTVYYLLASEKTRGIYSRIIAVVAIVALVNYMFFGKNYGNMTSMMRFDVDVAKRISSTQILINGGVVLAVAGAVWILTKKKVVIIRTFCILTCLVLFGMSTANAISIHSQLAGMEQLTGRQQERTYDVIHLDKNGKNVIVIMLDRAVGYYIPCLFQEKPELQQQFSGFVFYPNALSYGGFTLVASASVFGGYEYVPRRLNENTDMTLRDLQNEALRVMPVSFLNQGYEVTVCDPPYANHQWISDTSIYDDYPEMRTFVTQDHYGNGEEEIREASDKIKKRNLFCYSIFRIAPVIIQSELYDESNYNHADGTYLANGYSLFMGSYSVLAQLPQLTRIQETGQDRFLMFTNNATHDPITIQEPEYEPRAGHTNNAEYDAQHQIREKLDGGGISVSGQLQLECYQTEMAVLLQIGRWFNNLKEEGVWDNTRIIIVADHGKVLGYGDLLVPESGDEVLLYNPLLMVKDFGSHEDFAICHDFMTNADAPLFAMEGIVDPMINPFTHQLMTSADKKEKIQYVSTWNAFHNHMDEYSFTDVEYLVLENWDVLNPANWRRAE